MIFKWCLLCVRFYSRKKRNFVLFRLFDWLFCPAKDVIVHSTIYLRKMCRSVCPLVALSHDSQCNWTRKQDAALFFPSSNFVRNGKLCSMSRQQWAVVIIITSIKGCPLILNIYNYAQRNGAQFLHARDASLSVSAMHKTCKTRCRISIGQTQLVVKVSSVSL